MQTRAGGHGHGWVYVNRANGHGAHCWKTPMVGWWQYDGEDGACDGGGN